MVAGLFVASLLIGAEPLSPPYGPQAEERPRADGGVDRRDALAQFGTAVWNLRRERLLTAARQLEAAAKADPDALDPLRELVKLNLQLGREPDALRLARKVLAKDPDDFDTAAALARLLFDAGETQEAVTTARRALASKRLAERPDKAFQIARDLARLSEQAGDLAAAETSLRLAVGLVTEGRAAVVKLGAFTPKDADAAAADALEKLGRLLVKRGQFDPAAEAFESAAKLYADPQRADDPLAAARLGWNLSGALQAKGDPAGSLKPLGEFLSLQPQNPEPYQRLADLLRAANRPQDVVPTLRKYHSRDQLNRPLAAVLAAELARAPATRDEGDRLFAELTAPDGRFRNRALDPQVVAVMARSHLATGRAREVVAAVDAAFAKLDDDKKKDKPDPPGDELAKRFAGELARAVADALAGDPAGTEAVLAAAAEDLRLGTKRTYGTAYFLGALAARNRKLDAAEQHFRRAVQASARGAKYDAHVALIEVLWQARRPDKVERVCREAADPNAVQVFFNFHLALALAEQGQADKALQAADRAVEQAGGGDTNRIAVRLRRHRVLCVLGRWDEAIKYGQTLLDECETAADRQRIRYAQSGAYWGAKKRAEAEATLRAILADDPDSAGACNDLGYFLADQGRNLPEAEQLIRHAIRIDRLERRRSGSPEPESAAYRDSLGWVLFRQGKLAEAKVEFERALTFPDGAADPVVWDHLGDVLFRAGDKAKAKAAWEKAKSLYEDDLRLSSRGRRDGRLEEVVRKLTRVP